MIFSLSPPFPPSGLLQQSLRILNSLWMVRKACSCCYACYASVQSPLCLVTFGGRTEISKKATQTPVPRGNGHEWHGMCEKTGQSSEKSSAPAVWEFTPEQLQDSDKVTEYLQGGCCVSSRGQWTAPSGRRKQQQEPRPRQLQLNQGNSPCWGSHPCAEEGIQDKISPGSEGWRSRALRTGGGGRARENHLVHGPR